MKKSLIVVLSMLFVLGLAVPVAVQAKAPADTPVVAKGDTKITLGGELRMRGWYLDNYRFNRRGFGTGDLAGTPAVANSQGWYDTRVRLNIRADVTKNTTGFVQLESAGGLPPGARTSSTYIWGIPATINAKPDAILNFRQIWIQHKGTGLLGIPAGIKVGHMLMALGEEQFLRHKTFGNDAIELFIDPTKELHIGLITAKFREASVATGPKADDIDAYFALATYKLDKDNTVGIHYTFINDQTEATYKDLQNLGLHAKGKVEALTYNGEVNFQFGDTPAAGREYGGYGVLLGLGYKVDPANIRFQYAYGSGDPSPGAKDKEFKTMVDDQAHLFMITPHAVQDAR